ncbi:MAG: FHA domain-containing protein [Prochloraceae cyanobacterium]
MSSLQQQFEDIILIKDPKGQRTITLNTKVYTIGRLSTNDIVIYDRDVSRSHATLVKQKSTNSSRSILWLIDGNLKRIRSTNGLFVNKKLTLNRQLQIGDLVSLGKKSTIKYYRFSRLALKKLSKRGGQLDESTLDKMLTVTEADYKRTMVN